MTRSRGVQSQSLLVLSLSAFALLTAPPAGAEASTESVECYRTCAEALWAANCEFPQYPVCGSSWYCEELWMYTPECANDS